MQTHSLTREERKEQLKQLWNERGRGGKQQLLQLFYSIYPDGVPLPSEEGMIRIILNHEYGDSLMG